LSGIKVESRPWPYTGQLGKLAASLKKKAKKLFPLRRTAKTTKQHHQREPELIAVSPEHQESLQRGDATASHRTVNALPTDTTNAFFNSARGASGFIQPSDAGTAQMSPSAELMEKLPRLRVKHAKTSDTRNLVDSPGAPATAPQNTGQSKPLPNSPIGLLPKDNSSELSNTKGTIYPSASAGMDESKRKAALARGTPRTPNLEATNHTLGDDVGWPLKQKTVKREAKKQGVYSLILWIHMNA
jgi:hypothetical protein